MKPNFGLLKERKLRHLLADVLNLTPAAPCSCPLFSRVFWLTQRHLQH
jgi:hypothetical protein